MKHRPDRRCLPVTLFRVTAFGERSPARRQSLTEREAGAEIDHTLYENVPEWMVRPLGEWLFTVLVIDYPMGGRSTAEARRREKLAQRVLTHHRLATTSSHTYGWHIVEFASGIPEVLRVQVAPVDPLDLVDALVELHYGWPPSAVPPLPSETTMWWESRLTALEEMLSDNGSAWMVDTGLRGLYRRVDRSAVEARREAEATARHAGRPTAADHLATAWRKAYGRNPDPSGSYSSSVLAVEAASCPVVLEKATEQGTSIVHAVPNQLRDNPKLRFVLADSTSTSPGSAHLVANMVERLYVGQTQRHDNSNPTRNRPSTSEEARAAVHLAATLVQWFSSATVTKQP